MTVEELLRRFPEIPRDLEREPLLAQLAETSESLLLVARKPSACSTEYDAANHYYLALIGPFSVYAYGLSTREKVLRQIQELLDRQREDFAGFPASLLPAGTSPAEVKGPGCS